MIVLFCKVHNRIFCVLIKAHSDSVKLPSLLGPTNKGIKWSLSDSWLPVEYLLVLGYSDLTLNKVTGSKSISKALIERSPLKSYHWSRQRIILLSRSGVTSSWLWQWHLQLLMAKELRTDINSLIERCLMVSSILSFLISDRLEHLIMRNDRFRKPNHFINWWIYHIFLNLVKL